MSTPEKPSRFAGMIASKGTAPRPSEELQRAATSEPSTTPAIAPISATPQSVLGSKSLTLRLPDPEYERLRAYAFAQRKTHQAVLAEALKAYLDAMT